MWPVWVWSNKSWYTKGTHKSTNDVDGVRYWCEECQYQETFPGNLESRESMHEGVLYSCDQCEYKATQH